MIDLLEKRPSFNDNIRVVLKEKTIYLTFTNKSSLHIITPHVWNILRTIDGVKSVNDIFVELTENWIISIDELKQFFLDAHKNDIISFSDQPEKKSIKFLDNTFPNALALILTNKCNLRCSYCFGDYKIEDNVFFPYNEIEPLFQSLKNGGTRSIELTGGEPLLHPNFVQICELALSYFDAVSILSNGVLFNNKVIDFLKNNQNKRIGISISIDGSTEEANSKIRLVKNSWKKTLETIKILSKLNIELKVVYMLSYQNKHELLNACELMKNIGVKNFLISIPDSIGRGSSVNYPDAKPISNRKTKYFEELKEIIEEANSKYDIIINNPRKILEKEAVDINMFSNCGAGWKIAAIYPDGDVLACQNVGKAITLGNYFQKDLSTIFNNNPLVEYLSNFSKTPKRDECETCDYSFYCGSCIVKILMANKDLLNNGKELCPIAKENKIDSHFNLHEFEFQFKIC